MRKAIETQGAPKPVGPYSQAILSGGILFCSGQIAICPATETLAEGGIAAQTEQVIKNIEAVLAGAGFALEHVVKTTCFLADMEDFKAFNAVYETFFTAKPARSCVAAKQLPKNALVEIEVIAMQ